MGRIIHLIADSPYASMLIEQFESASLDDCTHKYIILTGASGLVYSIPNNVDCEVQSAHAEASHSRFTRTDFSALVVNGLSPMSPHVRAFPNIPKLWFVWGYEAYDHFAFSRELLPWRRMLQRRTLSLTGRGWRNFRVTARRDLWRFQHRHDIRDYFDTFDYCVCKFPEEFKLLKHRIDFSRPRHFECPVVNLESLIGGHNDGRAVGNSILVGNSSDPRNNHIEVFELLRRIGIPLKCKVIAPLSYGDDDYRKRLVDSGRSILGDRLEPITEFLDLQVYNELIGSCGIVIMNHLRQQALGNIIAAVYRGAIVYLNDTPVYRGLTRLGVDVRLVRSLRKSEQLEERLSVEQREKHRTILQREFGAAFVRARIRTLLSYFVESRGVENCVDPRVVSNSGEITR